VAANFAAYFFQIDAESKVSVRVDAVLRVTCDKFPTPVAQVIFLTGAAILLAEAGNFSAEQAIQGTPMEIGLQQGRRAQ
jgi:hypothetical protein